MNPLPFRGGLGRGFLPFRWSHHHSVDTLYNIVDICEVALAVAVVEYLYFIAFYQFIGKTEVCHVGAACWAIYCEETKSCTWNIVELAVGMRHKLVALLCGGIERYGVVYLVIGAIRNFLVVAIDTG